MGLTAKYLRVGGVWRFGLRTQEDGGFGKTKK